MSFLSSIAKIAKSVVKSPITKVIAGGVAVVVPVVGVPALAGLAAADKVVDATDKGLAAVKAARSAVGGVAAVPGGRVPFAAALSQTAVGARAKQGMVAAKIVRNTAKLAKAGDHEAQRALATMKLVKAAKQGQPMAKAALLSEVKSQIAYTLKAGAAPNATPQEKQVARLTAALIRGTAARKRASRKFGVDRRTARIVRVA